MSPRLLVVEDDEALAVGMANRLKDEGYTVDVAHDGEEGLEMILANSYALVITDVLMPVLSGPEMIERAQQTLGPVRCVMVGGMAPSPMPAGLAHATFVQRPVAMAALIAAVKAALD